MTLTVYYIFFQTISTLSTQDTADVKHRPHVHLVSALILLITLEDVALQC